MVWCRWLVLHRWSPYPGTCVRTCHTISPFVTQWRQHGPTVMLKHERWCWLIHLTLSICSNFRLFPSLMPLYIAIGFWMIFFCFSLTTDVSFTQDFIFENPLKCFYNWCKAFRRLIYILLASWWASVILMPGQLWVCWQLKKSDARPTLTVQCMHTPIYPRRRNVCIWREMALIFLIF